jgi:hypothetical protein
LLSDQSADRTLHRFFKATNGLLVTSSTSIVKTNTKNLYNYIYEMSFDQSRRSEGQIDFFNRETAAFWLPTFLLLDVSTISSTHVDPKQGLRLHIFEQAIASLGIAINTDYHQGQMQPMKDGLLFICDCPKLTN